MSKKIIILIIVFAIWAGGFYVIKKELYVVKKGPPSTLEEIIYVLVGLTHGKASKEGVVATYLEGLTQRNATKISRLVAPELKAKKEIRAKIDELGGNEFKDITVTYEKPDPETVPGFFKVHITGKMVAPSGTELPFDEIITIDMSTSSGKFYLLMGKLRHPLPEGIMWDEYATTSTLDTEQNMEEHLE